MSLLGIDVGTTGCRAIVFTEEGEQIASAYTEYDVQRPRTTWAELDVHDVWAKTKEVIKTVAGQSKGDPIRALSVSSLGEATVPVTKDRRILGPSLLNFDARGQEYVGQIAKSLDNERLYRINGNTLGNHYSLTKLLWTRDNQRDLFDRADKFLLWGSFVPFMLGAEPVVDFGLANRTLLFDIEKETWSGELLKIAGLDESKLPGTAPAGTRIGTISREAAEELGLPSDVALVTGTHDQCASAVGCGAVRDGRAMLGMGTFLCMAPVFRKRPEASMMVERGLNTEHHAVPGHFLSFIYNQGGSTLKWYRDTFAIRDHEAAQRAGSDVYDELISEVPSGPSNVLVLPHFETTGPPEFVADSCGVIVGLHLSTRRGEILKAILESVVFYMRECIESLPGTGIEIADVRVVGGGSKSDTWIQICADILGLPFTRPELTEAGALGAAIMAGTGVGIYSSMAEGSESVVRLDREFVPDANEQKPYDARFDVYRRLWPLMKDYLREIA